MVGLLEFEKFTLVDKLYTFTIYTLAVICSGSLMVSDIWFRVGIIFNCVVLIAGIVSLWTGRRGLRTENLR